MEIISRFVLHIENYFLLSHFSKFIIQWTLTALAVYGVVTFFLKKWDATKASVYVGFAVRFVLLIGLSIEMLHQVNITEITTVFYDRQPSLRQFLHFLFFGYMIVVGLYYIVTLKQQRNKGVFYTFDLAVMTLPAFQLLTSFFFYAMKGEVYGSDVVGFLIILSVIAGSLYLFFLNYWQVRWRTIIPFYLIIGFCLLLFLWMRQSGRAMDLMEVSNFIIFLGLLMSYHLINRSSFPLIKKWLQPFKLTIAVLFFVLCNPLYNAGNAALASTEAEISLRYYTSANLIQLEEAKELAMRITDEENFSFRQPETQDFHNRYWLRSENYLADIDGISGSVMNLHRQTEPEGEVLPTEEYITRSKQLLEKMGRTLLSDDQIQTTVTEEEKRVKIEMVPKFSDGTIPDVWMKTSFTWEQESLMSFHEQFNLYKIETLKDVLLTSQEMEHILTEWYERLGQELPEYIVDHVRYGYSNRTIDIYITTSNQHQFYLDGRTGEILYFGGELAPHEIVSYKALEHSILASKNIRLDKWNRERNEGFWEWRIKDSEHEEQKLSFVHRFGYTEGEPLFTYEKGIDYYSRPNTSVSVASRKDAYEVVKERIDYTPYASRAKLTEVIDEDNHIRLAWLIVIQPYKKGEHRLYLVDLETKEVTTLYE